MAELVIRPYEASVVIPVYNGAETISTQLRALAGQHDAPPFEVIVADNGSTDSTREIAESFSTLLDLRVIDVSQRRGPSYARNHGATAARSAWVLFCDADDRVAPTWVSAMRRTLGEHSLASGPTIFVSTEALVGGPTAPSRMPESPRRWLDQAPFAPSSNLGIRADVLRALGGFDCDLHCGEDAELTIRAQAIGHRLGWAMDAVVFYARRPRLVQSAKQYFRYGYYDPLVYRKLRAQGLMSRRPYWAVLRPYIVLALTPHRMLTKRRWSWVINASARAGRVVGSVRFRVLCL